MLLMMAGTCPIAILMGSAMLRRESPWGEWVVNWVITGVVSCAGGVTFFWLAASIWLFSWGPYPASWSGVSDYILGSMLGVALLSFGPVMAVAIASPDAALVSAPLSLLNPPAHPPPSVPSPNPPTVPLNPNPDSAQDGSSLDTGRKSTGPSHYRELFLERDPRVDLPESHTLVEREDRLIGRVAAGLNRPEPVLLGVT